MNCRILNNPILLIVFIMICSTFISPNVNSNPNDELWDKAQHNGQLANQSLSQCLDFMNGWYANRDPKTGLIPRNLTGSWFWNARDAAADNYPFMVLTAALLEPHTFDTTMHEILETETKLTNRLDNLPDDFDFIKQAFRTEEPNLDDMIFGGSEYVKDGLMPLTEWLGTSPWFERMIGIQDSVWKHSPIDTPFGKIPSNSHEVNGEQLQVLSRLYWMTQNQAYREYAFRLADYYFAEHIPTNEDVLRLRDHGCEVIGGLSEVYYLAFKTDQERYQKYQQPMHTMLDTILERGRNEDGMFYNQINPKTGEILQENLSDNWGYDYNAFYTVYMIDNKPEYKAAVEHVLSNIHNYLDYDWERGSSDGYADTIEGGLNLLNRIPDASAFDWVDQSMQKMLAIQRYDGVIEGWHGDGNFARTAIMYAFYLSKGTWITNWRKDVRLGGVMQEQTLHLLLSSDWAWNGKIKFDIPRHKEFLNIPDDYPRINQFPEWFTVDPSSRYAVTINGDERIKTGKELREGFEASSSPDKESRISVKPL
jgi:hypothetical protein